ncbi:TetR/AcrR family transcriptional regulator [Algirhabdus cladophorae]|uniref:TetR/AcrR family transcriptional regulator n=1 Tax=Algirhabdus cladophorae TaxID=3377108 RepID=UPI003B8461C0
MARKQGSHSDITGPKVQAAALRLFAQHGFAAVSMRQIASEVGVQAGALYNYTPDKQTLLFELLRTHMEALLKAWDSIERPIDPLAALKCFTEFHIAYHSDRPDQVFISYMELRNLSAENFAQIQALRRGYEQILEDILHAGHDSGLMNVPDIRVTSMALIALLTGLNNWFRESGRLSLADIQGQYWLMVRGAVAAVDQT